MFRKEFIVSNPNDPVMQRARAKAHQLRSFYGHLGVYAIVCTFLIVIDLSAGSFGTTFLGLDWAYWPVFGWGIGVALHALSLITSGSTWEERKAGEIYERQKQHH